MEMIDTDFSKTIEITIEAGIDQNRGHSQEIMVIIGIEAQVIVDQDQDLELVLIETE